MKKRSFRSKHRMLRRLFVTLAGVFVFICVPAIEPDHIEGSMVYEIKVDGEAVGRVADESRVQDLVRDARKKLASQSDELIFTEAQVETSGTPQMFGTLDKEKDVEQRILSVLKKNICETQKRAYTVKVNEYTINLRNSSEVIALLKAAKDKYDTKQEYSVSLKLDPTRELNVLTSDIMRKEEIKKENETPTFVSAGVEKKLSDIMEKAGESANISLGLQEIGFGDTVEVVEAYLQEDEISPLETAIAEITKDKDKEQIYEVIPGDTLSEIAEKNETTMENLIKLNQNIENENSTIRVGDEIIVTVPEPELSVVRTEEMYYEENYDAEVQYVDNDDWYTTDMKTLQEPVSGFHKIVADVLFRNESEISRDIIQEEIVMDAVPKIVERGTKVPPTYIKPISGGRLSSGFGRRSAPTRGASTYHRGIDWATPVGTAVMASSSGTISRAGWGSGYGYVVYINHADGRQTRYGHLSKVLVKSGQTVKQGDKIALSGNTGRSTGPHLHFEILIGGSQVNPLKYLN